MAAPKNALLELRNLIQEKSIRHGDFILASGVRSSYYCDTKASMLSPRGARLAGELIFEHLDGQRVEAVGGLAMGAVYIATAVALVSDLRGRPIYAFTVRDREKTHGLKKAVEESYSPDGRPLLAAGRRVAIVDDVVTSGGSIMKAVNVVRNEGCVIVAVIAIVDRNQGGGERLTDLGLPYFSLFDADKQGNLRISDEFEWGSNPHRIAAAGALG